FGPDDDRRVSLRRAGCDRGPEHRVLGAGRVLQLRPDAVEPVAVDVAASGLVADDRVVVPGVPEAADDVDDRTGFGPSGESRGGFAAAEELRLGRGVGDADGQSRT